MNRRCFGNHSGIAGEREEGGEETPCGEVSKKKKQKKQISDGGEDGGSFRSFLISALEGDDYDAGLIGQLNSDAEKPAEPRTADQCVSCQHR